MLDIQKIRNDFPLLGEKVFGNPLVYLDNAATTQKPACVIDKISELYRTQNANVHRGVHLLSQKATAAHEEARGVVAQFLNAESTDEIIFTRGTTESINLVAACFSELCSAGDEIIVSAMEHHSNIVPWQIWVERKGLKLRVIPIDENGDLIIDEYKKLLNPKTKMVALTHISNVLGTINDVKEVARLAHEVGSAVLIDGAQAVAHTSVDVRDIDADFYVFSGHKIYAPTGIGVLYGKREWLDRLPPYHGGGEMIEHVTFEKTTYNTLPYKFEAGTPDFINSVGLAEALKYLQNLVLDSVKKYEDELLEYATAKLNAIDGAIIYGKSRNKSGALAFNFEGVHNMDIGTLLDKTGVAIRTGHHCAEPLINSFGVPGVARASFAVYNTREEIDYFIEKLEKVLKILRG